MSLRAPWKHLVVWLAFAAVCISATACTPNSSPVVSRNRIVYGLTLSPSGFDPHVNQSSEIGIVLRQVYDTLVYRDPDTGQFVPGLAESWTVSPDQTTYTFTLKQGVTFHDGTPFNAAAVGTTLARITAPETRSQAALGLLGPYAGYEISDDYTISIILAQPFSPLLDGLSQFYLGIASPAALNTYSNERYQFNQVGTGPYIFVEYIPDERIVLRRNPNYAWGPPFYQPPAANPIEEIEFRFFTDPSTRLTALEQGDAQVIGELPPSDARVVVGSSVIDLQTVRIPGQPDQFLFNIRQFPTDNPTFRQALLIGLNRQTIVDNIYQGFSPAAQGPLTPGVQFYLDVSADQYQFDVQQARALISTLGFVDADANGYWDDPNGDLTLRVLVPPWGEYRQIVQVIQDQWRTIGVRVEPVAVPDFPSLVSAVDSGDYNLVSLTSYGVDPAFLRTYFTTDAARNWTGFANAEFDNLMRDAVQQLDPGLRAERYGAIQQAIMDQALILPIRNKVNLIGVSSRVHGLRFDVYGWYPIIYNASYDPSG